VTSHSPAIRIRACELDDLAVYSRLYNHPSIVRQSFDSPFMTTGEHAEQIVNSSERRNLVAEYDGGVIVGFGNLVLHAGRRAHAASIGLVVDPDRSELGIDMVLLGALLDLGADWHGIERFETKVYADNEPAIALYLSFGFEIEATHRQFAQREGAYASVYSLARIVE
jgi:L-phenylalanine/L-methionine N-acetyltransferase